MAPSAIKANATYTPTRLDRVNPKLVGRLGPSPRLARGPAPRRECPRINAAIATAAKLVGSGARAKAAPAARPTAAKRIGSTTARVLSNGRTNRLREQFQALSPVIAWRFGGEK